MKISKKQFDKLYNDKKLVVSLIGMSNMGKTHWSTKLADNNFEHINCDDLIEKKLGPILKKHGYKGLRDVSLWMGQPYEARFAKNQSKYLSLEKAVMQEVLASLDKRKQANTVVDTTGSVIHTGAETCSKLKKSSLVIYIQENQKIKDQMFERYIKEPKPVVFQNVFKKKKNEGDMDALKRCYKLLLTKRSALYSKYADVVIPWEKLNKKSTAEEFINLVKSSL